jgi:pimeloyl-CoA synthetase
MSQWQFFLYSLGTRKKIKKSIEIIKNGTHLSKAIIINLSKMKKINQNSGQSISNGLLNFAHIFGHTCKTHGYGLLFYSVSILHV